MLGERIANLRKSKGISQDELGEILSTSRQAISKWERGESDPDIGRLKDLAVYFNVSIDYLLGYDVEDTSANKFIERSKACCENGVYDISLDEIKMIVSRNSNNLNLILATIYYLSDYYYLDHDEAVLDLLTDYIKRAILLFQPNNAFDANLNSLHHAIASIYLTKGEHELAKQYIKDNQVIKSEELLSQCELSLGHYEEVEKITSEVFLSSIGALINSNLTSVDISKNKLLETIYLSGNNLSDALDLSDWSIAFTKSVGKDEENFLNVVYVFSFIKAYCEKSLGLDYSKTLKYLKDNRDKTSKFKAINDSIKFYNNKQIILSSETGDIKGDIFKEISELKDNNAKGYQNAFDIFNEVYGE